MTKRVIRYKGFKDEPKMVYRLQYKSGHVSGEYQTIDAATQALERMLAKGFTCYIHMRLPNQNWPKWVSPHEPPVTMTSRVIPHEEARPPVDMYRVRYNDESVSPSSGFYANYELAAAVFARMQPRAVSIQWFLANTGGGRWIDIDPPSN